MSLEPDALIVIESPEIVFWKVVYAPIATRRKIGQNHRRLKEQSVNASVAGAHQAKPEKLINHLLVSCLKQLFERRIVMRQISDRRWKKLEKFLNTVANEREEDSDGPGSAPSYNATAALNMIREFRMDRRKPAHIA
jgi:hypothetical protein